MMRRGFLLATLVLVHLITRLSYAQDIVRAYFTAEVGSPLIGEPIALVLTVEVPEGATIQIPQFPTDWPPFMVQSVGEVIKATRAGQDMYQRHLTVILWRTGEYQTPDIFIDYQPANADIVQRIQVQPAYFVVKSILNPDDLNLRPLKPPISQFYVSPLLAALIIVGLVLTGTYAWKWGRDWMWTRKGFVQADNLHISARNALADLRQINEKKMASANVYMSAGNVLRRYVEGRFTIPAVEMTTQELLSSLVDGSSLSERRQRELSHLLAQADLVKFAHLQPQPKSAEKMVDVAQRWVMAVEQDHAGTLG